MNNFLELHSDIDYIVTNRPYFVSTWEHIAASTTALIPFQFTNTGSSLTIYSVDTAGAETDITDYFIDIQKINSWADSGTGLNSLGSGIISWTPAGNDYITSNQFILTGGKAVELYVDTSAFDELYFYTLELKKGVTSIYSETLDNITGPVYVSIDDTGSDYTMVITAGPFIATSVTINSPTVKESTIHASGNYWWYDGTTLYDTFSNEVFILKVVASTTYYSDMIDICGFDGKLKYKVSSDEDFGGVKYANGFEQWIYKDANVNRAPRADIEVIGDTLNGEIVKEKITSVVRYVLKMRVTEPEYWAFVHSMAGDVEVTDRYGKVYDCQNLEITDPTWYRSNGVLEISFIDGNNINVWSKNNSAL